MVNSRPENIACAVFGASGYSGAELVRLLHNHPQFSVEYAFSSGARAAQPLADLYPQHALSPTLLLQAWHPDLLAEVCQQVRVIFLALPHEASAELVPQILAQTAQTEVTVFDLSGAFRLRDENIHRAAYSFEQPKLEQAQPIPYGLAEWTQLKGSEPLIAVPGCYPTVAALALKPLLDLLDPHSPPIINAVSGVSGAGRKASLQSHFCEVSLQAYGVGSHRHTPEIEQSLGRSVIFTPHLGNFDRGIVATIYAQLRADVSQTQVLDAWQQAYQEQPMIRLRSQPPAIKDVAHTPYCDLYAYVDTHAGQSQLIICAAIDNLIKGAAGQAVQLANQYFGLIPQSAQGSAHG